MLKPIQYCLAIEDQPGLSELQAPSSPASERSLKVHWDYYLIGAPQEQMVRAQKEVRMYGDEARTVPPPLYWIANRKNAESTTTSLTRFAECGRGLQCIRMFQARVKATAQPGAYIGEVVCSVTRRVTLVE